MKHSSKSIVAGMTEVVLGLILFAVAFAVVAQAGFDSSLSNGDATLAGFLGIAGVAVIVCGIVSILAGVIAIGVRVGMADHYASYATR